MQRFWATDGNRKCAVFVFNFSSHYHINVVKSLFASRYDQFENLRETTVLACEMFTSGVRPWLKNVACLSSLIIIHSRCDSIIFLFGTGLICMYEWICFFVYCYCLHLCWHFPKHKGENVHEKPQQKITYCWARRNSTGGFGGCQSTKTTRPINSNMLNSNCKLTIAFTTSTSNKLVNKNVCTSMCTWSTSIKHLESRTMRWFWWIS